MSSGTSPVIAVVMGGPSAEREVSLSTGRECARALGEAGFRVVEIDAGEDLVEQLKSHRPDAVFNALHGNWGEDGCVQGVFEWLRLPYTHSGVLASALAMDKERAKTAFAAAGLPVARSLRATRDEIEAGHLLPLPYVVKPVSEGSSVGVYILRDPDAPPPRLNSEMPDALMVETYVPGRELTVSVMGGRALGVTEILTDGWYDYDAKYVAGGSRHEIPAAIPDEISALCLDYALRAHACLGCRGVTRTDFRWDEARGAEGLFVLELNTQPGMTPTSLTPEQAAHAGLSFPEFCRWIVEDASCDR